MHRLSPTIVLIIGVLLSLAESHRFRRHRRPFNSADSSEDLVPNPHPMRTPPCHVLCTAQWKSDFQVTFQTLYESNYFDIPLDSVVLQSKTSLGQFCSITHQKLQCFRRECEMKTIEWSAERHICEDSYEDFKANHVCLSQTSEIVRRQCTDVCNNIKIELSHHEKNYISSMRLSKPAQLAYFEQNEHCHFVACHQMCHEQAIAYSCQDGEKDKTRQVVRNYYDSFLEKDWKDMEDSKNEKLYSSFCRRVTPKLDENEYVHNTTRFNNQILERMKDQIKLELFENK